MRLPVWNTPLPYVRERCRGVVLALQFARTTPRRRGSLALDSYLSDFEHLRPKSPHTSQPFTF